MELGSILRSGLRSVAASAGMGAVLLLGVVVLDADRESTSFVFQSIVVAGLAGAGAIAYLVLARFFRAPEIAYLRTIIKRRVQA